MSGLLHCKRCGRKLYGVSAKSGRHHYYVCRGYLDSGKATCDLGHIPRDKLDAIVVEKVRDVLLEPEYLATLANEVNGELGDRSEILQQRLSTLTAQIKRTEQKIGKLLDALENEEMPPAAVRPRLQERQRQLEQLRVQKLTLKAEDPASHVLTIEMDRVLPYVESLKETLSSAPIKTQRFILKSFIKAITVDRREITIEFSIPQESGQEKRHRTGVLGTVTSGTPDGEYGNSMQRIEFLRVRWRELTDLLAPARGEAKPGRGRSLPLPGFSYTPDGRTATLRVAWSLRGRSDANSCDCRSGTCQKRNAQAGLGLGLLLLVRLRGRLWNFRLAIGRRNRAVDRLSGIEMYDSSS